MTLEASEITILIVDDESMLVETVVRGLCARCYLKSNIFTAYDGMYGLDVALTRNPSVIITDFNMPRMNGVEMARKIIWIMSVRGLKPPPFIFVSSSNESAIREIAVSALGSVPMHVLRKPAEISEISMAIMRLTQS